MCLAAFAKSEGSIQILRTDPKSQCPNGVQIRSQPV